jgi:hypothetical protein
MSQNEAPDLLRARLARPETRYVGPFDLAIWRASIDRPPAEIAAGARLNAFGDRLLAALREARVPILAGSDTGNPFVVAGFSLHEELELLVRAGMTPYEALLAATRRAAEFLGRPDLGTIATGKRADLVLLDANPLADVRATTRIAGVMAGGRWLDSDARARLLGRVLDFARGRTDPFGGMTPLAQGGDVDFAATFAVTWGDTPFGAERIVVTRDGAIAAQSFDPHEGQGTTIRVRAGGSELLLDGDGASGRSHVEFTRTAGRVRASGVVLPGAPATYEEALPDESFLSVRQFLASKVLLRPTLAKLAVGDSVEIDEAEVSVGSAIAARRMHGTARRIADGTMSGDPCGARDTRIFEIARGKGPAQRLAVDARGWPVLFEVSAYGESVRFTRATCSAR